MTYEAERDMMQQEGDLFYETLLNERDAEIARLQRALHGIAEHAWEMYEDILADMQEGGDGEGLEEWSAVLDVVGPMVDDQEKSCSKEEER